MVSTRWLLALGIVIVFAAGKIEAKGGVVELAESNWDKMLEQEWMVELWVSKHGWRTFKFIYLSDNDGWFHWNFKCPFYSVKTRQLVNAIGDYLVSAPIFFIRSSSCVDMAVNFLPIRSWISKYFATHRSKHTFSPLPETVTESSV